MGSNKTETHDWMKLRWHCGTKYYEALLHQSLFGEWVVTRVNGSIGQPNGQVRHRPMTSYLDGIEALMEIANRRRARRYYYINCGG